MLNAVLSFVITAAVVYFLIVLPVNHFMQRHASQKDEAIDEIKKAEVTEVSLLGEIRDLLVAQRD